MASRIASGRPRRPTFVRQWRQHRGLTQKELADRLETSAASISRLEKGDQPYSQETLEAIADALDCEPQDLISHEPGTDAMRALWEQANPDDRETITGLARAILEGRVSLMQEKVLKEVRLGVAEHFARLFMAATFELGYTEPQVQEIARGIIDKYAIDGFGGNDPALSDMLSAEAEDEARSLVTGALELRPVLRHPQAPAGSAKPRVTRKKVHRQRIS
jgi:transcriptional regulator with XRE-family HTH domain